MSTLDELKNVLHYDPKTGNFYWKIKNNRRNPGDIAGCLMDGYVSIQHAGIAYRANRLAWWFMTGKLPSPKLVIEHHDANPANNRWDNLKMVTNAENMRNPNDKLTASNTSGHRGVCWRANRNKWQASIKVNGRLIHRGTFDTIEEAIVARKQAEQLYYLKGGSLDA